MLSLLAFIIGLCIGVSQATVVWVLRKDDWSVSFASTAYTVAVALASIFAVNALFGLPEPMYGIAVFATPGIGIGQFLILKALGRFCYKMPPPQYTAGRVIGVSYVVISNEGLPAWANIGAKPQGVLSLWPLWHWCVYVQLSDGKVIGALVPGGELEPEPQKGDIAIVEECQCDTRHGIAVTHWVYVRPPNVVLATFDAMPLAS